MARYSQKINFANSLTDVNSKLSRKYLGSQILGSTDKAILSIGAWKYGNLNILNYGLNVYKSYEGTSLSIGILSIDGLGAPTGNDYVQGFNVPGNVPTNTPMLAIRQETGKVELYYTPIGRYCGCIVY